MIDVPDALLSVHDCNDAIWAVDAADEPMLRAAVDNFRASGEDTRLTLTTVGGSELTLYAADVMCWLLTTAASRRREAAMIRAIDADRSGEGWQESPA